MRDMGRSIITIFKVHSQHSGRVTEGNLKKKTAVRISGIYIEIQV
jgi:hypothetical protein